MPREISDIGDGVTVSKRVTDEGDESTIRYRIEGATLPAEIRLIEQLSRPIERGNIDFPPSDEAGHWEWLDEQRLLFAYDSVDPDTVETKIRIRDAALEPEKCTTEVAITPDDGRDPNLHADGNGTVPVRADEYERLESTTRDRATGLEDDRDGTSPPSESKSDKPAVGLVATGDNWTEVVGTALDAVDRGHPVFVACRESQGSEHVRFAERLGATILKLDTDELDPEHLRPALTAMVQDRSLPGLILQADGSRVDLAESEQRFWSSDQTVIEAVPETTDADVIAGVPAYNEAETINEVVREARTHVDEVLVVDDGSDDETAARARDAGVSVIEHKRNRGYGSALKTLFRAADDREIDHLVVLDGDGQHDPEDIPRLLSEQRETEADVVIGNRFGGKSTTTMPRYRQFGLAVINGMVNLSMGKITPSARITDAQSGFRAYSSDAVSKLATDSDRLGDRMSASIDILYLTHQNGFQISEVGTTIDYDVSNANSQNPLAHGMNIVNHILKSLERKRPVTILGVPGFLVAVAGTGVGGWAVSNYITTGTFPIGLAILSVALTLAGFLASFTSVILHSLNTHMRESI